MGEIGRTGVRVPTIGFGTSGLGSMPDTYGYAVSEERARDTILAVLAQPDGFIDSARNYGSGRSEERIGAVVREMGGWPEGRVLATKLDRDMDTLRFDAAQARRSLEESLAALAVDRVDILHLHDPEHTGDPMQVARPGGAIEELFRMKEEGIARALGLAAGPIEVMMPLLRDFDFDCLVTHNRFTPVNRNADPMLDLARERGIAVFNAAPYAGGALAKGADQARYVYQELTDATKAPILRIEELCARYGVAPGAVALQFSMRDPRVASTICGVTRPERVQQTLDWAALPIPDALWDELAGFAFSTDDPEATRDYQPG